MAQENLISAAIAATDKTAISEHIASIKTKLTTVLLLHSIKISL